VRAFHLQTAPEMRAGLPQTFARPAGCLLSVGLLLAFTPWVQASRPRFSAAGPEILRCGYDAGLRMNAVASAAGTFNFNYSPGVLVGTTCGSSLIEKTILPSGAYVTNAFDSVARLLSTKLRNSSNTDLNTHAYLYNLGNHEPLDRRGPCIRPEQAIGLLAAGYQPAGPFGGRLPPNTDW